MIKFSDAHCHFQTAPVDIPELARCITNAAHQSDWKNLIKIQSDNVFICLGVHPWYVADADTDWDKKLCEFLDQNPKIMVGETGLDKLKTNLPVQESFFVHHMEIAHKYNRTLHIHCVKAWHEILHILKNNSKILPPRILFHGFAGAPDIIEELSTKYNAYFSYSTLQTNPNISRHRERVLATPCERILLESDAETSRTSIQKLISTCNNIAEILDESPDNIANLTNNNFQRIISQ